MTCRKLSKFGIFIPHEALEELKSASSPEMSIVKGMRQAFYIATSISSLLMLVPKKYHALWQTIQKDTLVAVSPSNILSTIWWLTSQEPQYSMSLGNEQPECLSRVKRSLWKMFLWIASGSHLLAKLHTFMGSYSNILQLYNDNGRQNEWFAGCK